MFVFKELKKQFYNTSLRQKLVVMISTMTAIFPTILIAVLAYSYYAIGIESLFNDNIRKALDQSVEIAKSYLQEHKENIKTDILEIANDISRNKEALEEDKDLYTPFFNKQASLRNLSEILIFQRDKLIAKNSFSLTLAFEKFPEQQLLEAERGEVIILDDGVLGNKVRALLKLRDYSNTYLLIGRYVDRDILEHLRLSQGSVDHFSVMMSDINNTRYRIEIIFLSVGSLLLILTILLAFRFARYITKPLNLLVDATEKVKKGDFTIRLPEKQGRDETATLTRAFNQMTDRLADQHNQLNKFTQVIDERRRFIEAVLSEVTAGVIVISTTGEITLHNFSASKLLGIRSNSSNLRYKKIFPEISDLLNEVKEKPAEIAQGNIEINQNGQKLTFLTRVGAQIDSNKEIEGYIATFDDITDLVSAQRSAAWADVARRIAHEIKNPLTPISLSAERLKKKYLNEITTDKENFEKYLDTIIRHVSDIGKIVEEFVEFARIPQPKISSNEITKIIQDAIFSQHSVYKNINYIFDYDGNPWYVLCDSTQITQVLINLLKNSAESIESQINSSSKVNGEIKISLRKLDQKYVEIKIKDNGMGFDKTIIDRVTEPYVTNKIKGTGLGLPIVKKIIEDHGGVLVIANSKNGAIIKFNLLLGDDSL